MVTLKNLYDFDCLKDNLYCLLISDLALSEGVKKIPSKTTELVKMQIMISKQTREKQTSLNQVSGIKVKKLV